MNTTSRNTLSGSEVHDRAAPSDEPSITGRLLGVATVWAEQGRLPDWVVRAGIRRLLRQRLEEIDTDGAGDTCAVARFVRALDAAPVAPAPEKANDQHYELPSAFFETVLGPQLKYSCAYWDKGASLAEAETQALRRSCDHARLEDGQNVLELGCGWGALTLWMATRYPGSHITAVSNSHSQRRFIESRARTLGLTNLHVVTRDMNDFYSGAGRFDRVVSVEMFEHMRNWGELYRRIAYWLKPGGLFFKHIFVHQGGPYLFEDKGAGDWMSRHFFSGGMMPSDELPLAFQRDLDFIQRWRWNGSHYRKTADAWLSRMDTHRRALWPLLETTYGDAAATQWWNRWRMFFMACSELFGYEDGRRWRVGHYLFEKPRGGRTA